MRSAIHSVRGRLQKAAMKLGLVFLNPAYRSRYRGLPALPLPNNMSNSTLATDYPPEGTNWVAAIVPAVNFLMIGATAGSVEFVMLCALLFFSTSALRRTPIFILNVVALLIGLSASALNVYEEVCLIFLSS